MASLVCMALMVLILSLVGLDAKPATLEDLEDAIDSVSSGRLYALEENGVVRSLHRRDVQSIKNDKHHHIRLSLDNGLPPLDMHLKQRSVWDRDSVLVIGRSERTFNVPHAVDSGCYLHGQVHSHRGAVSINRCGRMTGQVHVPGHTYELEEMPQPVDGDGQHHAHFTVTRRKTDEQVIGEDEVNVLRDRSKREIIEPVIVEEDNNTNTTSRKKRAIRKLTVELAVYADANYVDTLVNRHNLRTNNAIREWFVTKWNVVAGALSNPRQVGAEITIKLKKIHLWWENPQNYPPNRVGIRQRLDWFCENTPGLRKYDTVVLYSDRTYGGPIGMAAVGGTCNQDLSNCFLVKIVRRAVSTDIHEFGHSLGFPHDPNFNPPCGDGFMGWTMTYDYLPCYKRKLTSLLNDGELRCLFEETVGPDDDDEIQTPAPTMEEPIYQHGC